MPKLDWIGKQAVVGHHLEVPYRLVHCNGRLSGGDADSDNLLVQGDNLEALRALLPYYAGKVKCVYIDPPYNTGNEEWVYNDKVNSPQIRKWLNKTVGSEVDDLCRHDKWLCMMYPRLRLLREMMHPEGVIFISIGKDEFGHLKILCDLLFGNQNFLDTFIWQVEGNVENQEDIKQTHEYILAYQKVKGSRRANKVIDPNVSDQSKLMRDFTENSVIKNGPGNPASIITLPAGFSCEKQKLNLPRHKFAKKFIAEVNAGKGYIERSMKAQYEVAYPVRLDDMVVEDGVLVQQCRVYSGWAAARKIGQYIDIGMSPLHEEDGSRLHFFLSHNGTLTYRKENRTAHFVETILRNMGTTEKASNELERMGIDSIYPKPRQLVRYLLSLYARSGDLVMDSFSGSGTTGHAVLDLNQSQNLNLSFILIEMENEVAEKSARRLKSVIHGYTENRGARKNAISPLGGGFRYCTLGKPLFNENGHIAKDVKFSDLAAHVFFSETGTPIPKRPKNALLGVHEGRAIYLLYNGIMGDQSKEGGNMLTLKTLHKLPPHPDGKKGVRLIFGEGTFLSEERLAREKIIFCQIPYRIRKR